MAIRENVALSKSFDFAVEIIKTYKSIQEEFNEYNVTRQLLRSGTSIGANLQESVGSESERDFLHKLSISYKEARESRYWIMLLSETNYLNNTTSKLLLDKVEELLKILGASIITIKRRKK